MSFRFQRPQASRKICEQKAAMRLRRLSKKESVRLVRAISEFKAKAGSESEDRQENIKVLWGLKEQDLKGKTYNQRERKEREIKSQKLEKVLYSVRALTDNDAFIGEVEELVELAHLQDREIEYLTQFRHDLQRIEAHYPEQLEKLRCESLSSELPPLFLVEQSKRTKRRRYKSLGGGDDAGLIEYEFGGAGEAEWRKSMPSGLSGDPPYQPICLDDIFRGGVGEVETLPGCVGQPSTTVSTVTNMQRLEALFGMHRNRFPQGLPHRKKGREILYDWLAVVKIMDALLSEKPTTREKGARGGSQRKLWLNDPDDPGLRTRVLRGIEKRMNSIPAGKHKAALLWSARQHIFSVIPKHIKAEFLAVIHRHLPDSAK